MHVKTPPSRIGYPPLLEQTPAKNWDPAKAPLLENLIGGSPPISCTHTHRNTHTHTHTHSERGSGAYYGILERFCSQILKLLQQKLLI